MRSGLSVVSVVYGFVVKWRNRRYDRNPALVHDCSVPVICVGNLTMGGTGKTPMVRYLVERLAAAGKRVAIVSRGYRSDSGEPNDEAKELARHLPDVPHLQHPDRVLVARRAVREHQAEVIVLDDGFQHRRLRRELDIVLIDALEPFGFEHVFPRGTLREPLRGLKRAHLVGLSRSDLVSSGERTRIRQRVAALNSRAIWLELAHRPTELQGWTEVMPLAALAEKRVLAFCGLGNPDGFRSTLDTVGATLVDFVAYPDHHAFTQQDFTSLRDRFDNSNAELVVCTHKDFVKLDQDQIGDLPVFALIVELEIRTGERELNACLEAVFLRRDDGC